MAIAYDNSLAQRVLNGSSFSYTAATGSHMFAVTETNVTAITYGGFSLGNIINFTPSIHDGNENTVLVWEIVSPLSGANNFSISAGVNAYAFAVVTYTGLEGSQPNASNNQFSNNGSNNTQVTTLPASVTSTVDNCWAVTFVVGGNNASRTFVAGAGTTARASTGGLDTHSIGILDGNGVISPAGATTLNPTWSSSSGFMSTVTLALSPQLPNTFVPYMMVV